MASGRSPGRQPKDPEVVLRHKYTFRLNNADNQRMQDNINASSLSESEFLREAVIRNKTQIIAGASTHKRPATRKAVSVNPDARRLLFLAAQTSNNINQLAYAVNIAKKSGAGLSQSLLEEILQELHKISEAAKGWV